MLAELSSRLAGKRVLVLGVGNRLRGDDAVGPLLVDHLQGKVNVPLIDAGDVPENYLGPIEESGADLVLVLDATDLGAKVGDAAIFDIEQIQGKSISTHTANLGLLFKVMPPETRPQVIVLGIQPGNIEFGQGLSDPVRATMENLTVMLIEVLLLS
ncbi:MAG: hydrogenase 3 maturation endopeptidase HyCI [Anaerolineales bacterium]|nr:hydrogenase 3 maturation endopeptidase HyCI [Anaerolineales bacterium]